MDIDELARSYGFKDCAEMISRSEICEPDGWQAFWIAETPSGDWVAWDRLLTARLAPRTSRQDAIEHWKNWFGTIREEWRALGFYYDCIDSARHWLFAGSRSGLRRLCDLLVDYASDEHNSELGEHDHFGPYMYLKVMTRDEPGANEHAIFGTLDDLRGLALLINRKLDLATIGDTFWLYKDEFSGSPSCTYDLRFDLMEDGFDPATLDPQCRFP